jgi:hypothetical protein
LATKKGFGFSELAALEFESAQDAHRTERVRVAFPEDGDFERQYRAVEVRGLVEAGLAIAEAGELGAEVDDRSFGAAGGGLEQRERLSIEFFCSRYVVGGHP